MVQDIQLLNTCSKDQTGAKGANLKKVGIHGNYTIPITLVLTFNFYEKLLKYNNIRSPDQYDWKKLVIPQNLEDLIFSKIQAVFGNARLVVRSSASNEDSPLLSFAGQYSSFLNIKSRKQILRAIKLCYASLYSKNAKIYSQYNDVDLDNQCMAILIQEVKKIEKSGIMFTADPVDGNKKVVTIEYSSGLGDKVVGGKITPHSFRFNKKDFSKAPLFLQKIIRAGIDIEHTFKKPQDIEWGTYQNTLYIFQSRPITISQVSPMKIPELITRGRIITRGKSVCRGCICGNLVKFSMLKDKKNVDKNLILIIDNSPTMELLKVMPYIGGIIIQGGILSHFAVIAREFNKPCIAVSKTNFKFGSNHHYLLDATIGKVCQVIK